MPSEFIEYAQLDGVATFVGLGKGFQIWEPKTFMEHRAKNRERARKQGATLQIVSSNKTVVT